jgi:hypothetical protein
MAGAGIGEVSAVATFLQIGFSLATTLTTYIADVKDAPDEIAGLASEIDSTLRHVGELDLLLLENEKRKVGMKTALSTRRSAGQTLRESYAKL